MQLIDQESLRTFMIVTLSAAACFLGCSSDNRPKGVSVAGLVTYQGQPVANADIAFSMGGSDQDGTGAFGRTDESGRFELSSLETSVGIPPGSYQVKVTKFTVDSDWTPDHDEGVRPKESVSMGLPTKYASFGTSNLMANITEGGSNDFTFDLTN